uniref:Uncharacterized protein n=1 Tax=Trichuris muris TaxID=70415 RepID=A0A5S6QZK5_TRIMR
MAVCSRVVGMSSNCAVGLQKRLREVAAESLLRVRLVIGGPGLTVELDETAFSKRKYQRSSGSLGACAVRPENASLCWSATVVARP